MERALALQVMDAIRAAEVQVNTLELLSMKIADEKERKEFRRYLAQAMIGFIDIQMSIVRQYADLDPDRRRGGETVDRDGKS